MKHSNELSLCFLKKGDEILLINRNYPPFMGQWNAVGGHKKDKEDITYCAIREIKEETDLDIKPDKLKKVSKFTWNYDNDIGYIFLVELDNDFPTGHYPVKIDEGIIDFKPISWIMHEKNTGIIDDLKVFIEELIFKKQKVDYHLTYNNQNKLVKVERFIPKE